MGDHIGTFDDHDLVLLGPNLPHNWIADEFRGQKIDMHEAIVTQFNRDFLGPQFFETPEAIAVAQLLARAGKGLWFPPETGRPVGERLRKIPSLTGIHRITELLGCLEQLSQCKSATELASEGYVLNSASTSETKIQIVFDYIAENLTDPKLTAGRLAELLEMNTSAFCRLFKRRTGRTPTNHLNELRIGFARRLLLSTDSKILDVCFDSGFSSVSYFNRQFKKHFAMSPTKFRTQHRDFQNSSVIRVAANPT